MPAAAREGNLPPSRSRRRPRSALGRTATATASLLTAAAAALLLSSSCGGGPLRAAEAFVGGAPPAHRMRRAPIDLSPGTTSSRAAGSSSSTTRILTTGTGTAPLGMAINSSDMQLHDPRLSPSLLAPAEERRLLALAAESARLRSVERALALSTPRHSQTLAAKASAAGYGEDEEGREKYEAAYEAGQMAREELITRNMGLVHHVVNGIVGGSGGRSRKNSNNSKNSSMNRPRVRLNSLSRDDLLQEGALGLSRAIDRYDPTLTNGGRFATYATYWIRAAVLRAIAERDDLVRVPVYVSETVRKLTAAAGRLGIDLDEEAVVRGVVGERASRDAAWREATRAKQLAEEAGLSDRQLAEAVRVRRRRRGGGYTSLDGWDRSRLLGGGATARAQRVVTPTAAAPRAAAAAAASASASPSMATTSTGPGAASPAAAAANGSVAVTPTGETTDDVDAMRRVLAEHLKPKEMEALSWRYGLNRAQADTATDVHTKTATTIAKTTTIATAATTTTTARTTRPQRPTPVVRKDYEEEALEELFGTDGMLASYSANPLPSTAWAIQDRRSEGAASNNKKKKKEAPPQAPTTTATAPAKGGRWGEAMSFAEVGHNMAVSAEYGRRLCGQALRKLQDAADEGRLEFQPDWLSA